MSKMAKQFCPFTVEGCVTSQCSFYEIETDTCPVHVMIEKNLLIDLLTVYEDYGKQVQQELKNRKNIQEEQKNVECSK